ncbi:MAG: patatin-like phospholipase family protein [Bacteroidota bacterium]
MESIGIVLSGGGVRGMAHVGLLEILEKHGVKIDCLAGSSAGALVGALYSKGLRGLEIIEALESVSLFSISNYTWTKPGLIDTLKLRSFVQKYLPENDFKDLTIPTYIVTTNLKTGEEAVHHSGELYRPLLASISLPPYFSPIRIDESWHADGGIVNNFPSNVIRDRCDFLIGSHVCPLNTVDDSYLNSSFNVWWRAYELNFYANTKKVLKQVDFLFEPAELCSLGTMDTKSMRKAYHIGKAVAEEQWPMLLEKWKGLRQTKESSRQVRA